MPSQWLRVRAVSRRAALLGGVGGVGSVAFAACDTDDLRPPDADAPLTPSATAPGAPTADEALVTEAADAIRTAWTSVAAARTLRPLRQPLSALFRAQRAHLEALDDASAGQPGPDVASAPADASTALAAVGAAEQTLQQQLADLAIRAESGTLAALLASMSASVAQHVSALGSAA